MISRVSTLQVSNALSTQISNTSSRYLKLTEQISTGKKVTSMTDDVVSAKGIINANKQLANLQQYISNMQFASKELSYVDSLFSNVSSQAAKANDIAITASNGTYSAEQLDSFRAEVDVIINNVKTLANTQYNDTYLFSGTKTTSQAYTIDEVTGSLLYNGDSGTRKVEVDEASTEQINFTGDNIFGQAVYIEDSANPGSYIMDENASSGLFKSLYQLRDSLGADEFKADDARATLDGFKTSIDDLTSSRTKTGLLINSLEDLVEAYETSSLQITELKSNLEDVDLTSAVSDWYSASQALQASYSIMSQSMGVSLLDYM